MAAVFTTNKIPLYASGYHAAPDFSQLFIRLDVLSVAIDQNFSILDHIHALAFCFSTSFWKLSRLAGKEPN